MNSTECVRSIRCASSSIHPSLHWTYAPLNPCLLLCCYWGRSKICISSRESPFIDIKKWTRPLLPMLHNTQSSFSSTVSIHPSIHPSFKQPPPPSSQSTELSPISPFDIILWWSKASYHQQTTCQVYTLYYKPTNHHIINRTEHVIRNALRW